MPDWLESIACVTVAVAFTVGAYHLLVVGPASEGVELVSDLPMPTSTTAAATTTITTISGAESATIMCSGLQHPLVLPAVVVVSVAAIFWTGYLVAVCLSAETSESRPFVAPSLVEVAAAVDSNPAPLSVAAPAAPPPAAAADRPPVALPLVAPSPALSPEQIPLPPSPLPSAPPSGREGVELAGEGGGSPVMTPPTTTTTTTTKKPRHRAGKKRGAGPRLAYTLAMFEELPRLGQDEEEEETAGEGE